MGNVEIRTIIICAIDSFNRVTLTINGNKVILWHFIRFRLILLWRLLVIDFDVETFFKIFREFFLWIYALNFSVSQHLFQSLFLCLIKLRLLEAHFPYSCALVIGILNRRWLNMTIRNLAVFIRTMTSKLFKAIRASHGFTWLLDDVLKSIVPSIRWWELLLGLVDILNSMFVERHAVLVRKMSINLHDLSLWKSCVFSDILFKVCINKPKEPISIITSLLESVYFVCVTKWAKNIFHSNLNNNLIFAFNLNCGGVWQNAVNLN